MALSVKMFLLKWLTYLINFGLSTLYIARIPVHINTDKNLRFFFPNFRICFKHESVKIKKKKIFSDGFVSLCVCVLAQ